MGIPQLPNDIIINILKERMNIKKEERYEQEKKENKLLFDEVMTDFMSAVNQYKMDEIITSHDALTMEQATEIFSTVDNSEFIGDYIVDEGYNHLNNYLMG